MILWLRSPHLHLISRTISYILLICFFISIISVLISTISCKTKRNSSPFLGSISLQLFYNHFYFLARICFLLLVLMKLYPLEITVVIFFTVLLARMPIFHGKYISGAWFIFYFQFFIFSNFNGLKNWSPSSINSSFIFSTFNNWFSLLSFFLVIYKHRLHHIMMSQK